MDVKNDLAAYALTLTNPLTVLSFGAIFAGLGMADDSRGCVSGVALIVSVFAGSLLWWLLLCGIVSVFRKKFNNRVMRLVNRFLAAKFPSHQFPTKLAAMIHQRTEGNPLFMVNVVDYLVDEKIVAEHEGHWQLQVELDEVELEVPENIRYLIEKHIERLSEDEQRVLEGASVVGMDCSAVAMAAGLNEDVVKTEEMCDGLARRQHFLLPAYLAELPDGTVTPRYRFIHALYLDVLYKRVAATRRSQIHGRIGVRGETIYGERVGEIAAELAVHFEQARDSVRAVKYLQLAAENAARRSANHEAVTLARRGLELLKTLPETPERAAQELSLQGRISDPRHGVTDIH